MLEDGLTSLSDADLADARSCPDGAWSNNAPIGGVSAPIRRPTKTVMPSNPVASRSITRFIARMNGSDHSPDAALNDAIHAVADCMDRSAFKVLFDHYGPRIKAYLKRSGASNDQAEDLTQEVMVSVWRRAKQFDAGKASLTTWIFTIARNKRIDSLRREHGIHVELSEALHLEEASGLENNGEINQLSRQVAEAVKDLPAEQRDLLKIFYFEEKTHSEIADAIGIPLGTVKSRLRLALGKLRTALGAGQE